MIRLTQINWNNAGPFSRLEVNENQKEPMFDFKHILGMLYCKWVSSGVQPLVYGIAYGDTTAVGVIAVNYETLEEGHYLNNDTKVYEVWSLYIDKEHQGKGYGKAAMEKMIELLRTMPNRMADYVYLAYEAENEAARKLYTSLGFVETGDDDCGSIVARLVL